MRQQRLAIERKKGATWRAGEEAQPEIALKDCDSLGDSLLADPQPSRGALKLGGLGDGDERADSLKIHTPHSRSQPLVVGLSRQVVQAASVGVDSLLPCGTDALWAAVSGGYGPPTRSAPTEPGSASGRCPNRISARLADVHPAAARDRAGRRRQDRIPDGQRRSPERPGRTRTAAHSQQPL